MSKIEDKELQEGNDWIYNNWNIFALIMAIITSIGVGLGIIISHWNIFLGVVTSTLWSVVIGMCVGMTWVECGKPKHK